MVSPPHSAARGIAYMVAAMFCFALMNTFVRQVSFDLPTPLVVFIRNLMSLGLMLPWVVYHMLRSRAAWAARLNGASSRMRSSTPFPLMREWLFHHGAVLKTTRMRGHLWRAGIGIISMELWFYSLSVMKLTEATALSFTTPIFVTILAAVFLKEKVGIHRWSAIIIGFMGVLVILHPSPDNLNHGAWMVLVSSAIMAWSSLTVKSLMKTEHPNLIVFYMTLFMTILSAPFGLMMWEPMHAEQLFYLFLIALFSTLAHLFLTRAYPHAPLAVLMPFDFTRLIFIAVFAYLMFGEVVDGWTVTGSIIIVASTVYIAHREALHKKKMAVLDTASNE